MQNIQRRALETQKGNEMAKGVSDAKFASLMQNLGGSKRRVRQEASSAIALIAREDPTRLYDQVGQLVDALSRPEAQTRWEILDALTDIAQQRADLVGKACEGAETALFDEASSAVRLSAFKFLTVYGKSSPERSNAVWHLLDEAIQCYDGDPGYRDMLSYLIEFTRGDISDETREALNARVKFYAEHGRGYIKAFSSDIIKLSDDVK